MQKTPTIVAKGILGKLETTATTDKLNFLTQRGEIFQSIRIRQQKRFYPDFLMRRLNSAFF
jgi:hypothetical protein